MQVFYVKVYPEISHCTEFICDINDAIYYAEEEVGKSLPNLYRKILLKGMVIIKIPNSATSDFIQIAKVGNSSPIN